MCSTDLDKLFYTVQTDFKVEAANIAALVFPRTRFRLFLRNIGMNHAASVSPKAHVKLSLKDIGDDNLAIFFKSQTDVLENFQVQFFPKIKSLILSGHYKDELAHLYYYPDNDYDWFNSKGYTIARPDCIGEKFEFLADKFYPFFEEYFLE